MLTAPTNVRIGTGAPPTGNPHAHFEALRARADHLRSWSLRDQAELDSLVKLGPSYFWRYTNAHPYAPGVHYGLDAAMLAKPPRSTFNQYSELVGYGTVGDENVPGNQIPRFPLGLSQGRLMLVWNLFWADEMRTNAGTKLQALKTHFLYFGTSVTGTSHATLLKDSYPQALPGEATHVMAECTAYDALGLPAGQTQSGDIFQSTGLWAPPPRTVPTRRNAWTRYWFQLRMARPGAEFTSWSQAHLGGAPLTGTWDMVSCWLAPAGGPVQRVFYEVPMPRVQPQIAHFRLSFDTSTTNTDPANAITGPLVMYARNMVVLHDPSGAGVDESDGLLFESPELT